MVDRSELRDSAYWRGWAPAFLLCAVLAVAATLPPFVGPLWRAALMHVFSHVCHQIAERSPALDGIPLAVCHRCYGFYVGLLCGTAVTIVLAARRAMLNRHAVPILAIGFAPAALDWLLGVAEIWSNTPFSRTTTGWLCGTVAGVYMAFAFTGATRR